MKGRKEERKKGRKEERRKGRKEERKKGRKEEKKGIYITCNQFCFFCFEHIL